MDFELSADQRELRSAARELLDARSTTEQVRKAEGFDVELWREMSASGWAALAVPATAGRQGLGLGLGWVEVAVLAEEIGRHVASVPYLSTALAAAALAADPANDEAAELLDRLLSGGVGAVVWDSAPVVDGPVAGVVVVVRADGSVSGHEVPVGTLEPVPAMDLTRLVSVVDVAALGPGIPLGGPELGQRLLDQGATAYAAELLGAASRMLDATVEYAKLREQFGRPIGSFQAVKHRCADMFVDVDGMRSAAYYAAWAVATSAPDASLAASAAKSWSGDAGERVMASALQVHGGIGFTWEHDLHLYLKRTQLSGRLFGDAAWHRERIIRLLREREERGEGLF